MALIRGKLGSGTGFLAGPNLIVTNSHVVDDEFIDNHRNLLPLGRRRQQGADQGHVALRGPEARPGLPRREDPLPPLEVAPSYNFRKGEDITVIGNPGMGDDSVLENAISRGIMSTKTTIEGQAFYQLNIAINPGNSGGPVFDSMGRVIGVATLKAAKQEGMAFCIPVDDLNAALDAVHGVKPRPRRSATPPSRHRTLAAFKLADVRRRGPRGRPRRPPDRHAPARIPAIQIGEKRLSIADFDKVLADLDAKAFGPAATEAAKMPQRPRPRPVEGEATSPGFGTNYAAMRLAHRTARRTDPNTFWNQSKNLKLTHAKLVEDLGKSLQSPVAPGLLAALRNDVANDPMSSLAGVQQRGTSSRLLRPLRRPACPDGAAPQRRPPEDAGHARTDGRDAEAGDRAAADCRAGQTPPGVATGCGRLVG